jgi:Uma2 family endonuclease
MSALAEVYISPSEYLELERLAETKSEYLDGRIYAMAGASLAHNTITMNLSREFGNRLRGGACRPFAGDLRVKVSETGLYTYPDLLVVCGELRFDDDARDTLLNPTLIVEVLSPSTEQYDRGEKFAHYQHLESITDYVLIAQDRPRVEHFHKLGHQEWALRVSEGMGNEWTIPSVNCNFRLADIYEKVEFPTEISLR